MLEKLKTFTEGLKNLSISLEEVDYDILQEDIRAASSSVKNDSDIKAMRLSNGCFVEIYRVIK